MFSFLFVKLTESLEMTWLVMITFCLCILFKYYVCPPGFNLWPIKKNPLKQKSSFFWLFSTEFGKPVWFGFDLISKGKLSEWNISYNTIKCSGIQLLMCKALRWFDDRGQFFAAFISFQRTPYKKNPGKYRNLKDWKCGRFLCHRKKVCR